DKITKLIISAMLKRKIEGIHHGVAMVSEGVFHFLSDDQVRNSGIAFTYDEHGHPELGNVSKAHIFNVLVQKKLKELGISIKSRPVEMGYELRCTRPVAYDLTLCTLLGMGVKQLFDRGETGCIVSTTSKADIQALYLNDLKDESGKIPPRLVDVDNEFAKLVFSDFHVLCEPDYEKAKILVPDPEEYDFYKILNWDFDPSLLRPLENTIER
ncbi:MAG: 6-phosphofructokinase, partial [Bacteroidota bacterium]